MAVVAVPLDDLVAVAVALLAVNVTPYIMHFSTHSRNKYLRPYHCSTKRLGSCFGICEVRPRARCLNTGRGAVDESLAVAKTGVVGGSTVAIVSILQA